MKKYLVLLVGIAIGSVELFAQNPVDSTLVVIAGQDAQIAYNEGTELFKQKDFEGAIHKFTVALGFDANFAKAYLNRGSAQMEMKHYQLAIEDLDKAISLSPDLGEPYYIKGRVHQYQNQNEEALASFLNAETKGYVEANLFYFIGFCNSKKNSTTNPSATLPKPSKKTANMPLHTTTEAVPNEKKKIGLVPFKTTNEPP